MQASAGQLAVAALVTLLSLFALWQLLVSFPPLETGTRYSIATGTRGTRPRRYLVSLSLYGRFSNGRLAFGALDFLARQLGRTLVLPKWDLGIGDASPSSFYDVAHMRRCGLDVVELEDVEEELNRTAGLVIHLQHHASDREDFRTGSRRGWQWPNGTDCDFGVNCDHRGGWAQAVSLVQSGRWQHIVAVLSREPFASLPAVFVGATFLDDRYFPLGFPCPLMPLAPYLDLAKAVVKAAFGGSDWLGVHARRTDFEGLLGQPNASDVADFVRGVMRRTNATRLYLATDAEGKDREDLIRLLPKPVTLDSALAKGDVRIPPEVFKQNVPEESVYDFVDKLVLSFAPHLLYDNRSTYSLDTRGLRAMWGIDGREEVFPWNIFRINPGLLG
ncbi:hypothetical protein DFJ74DRAFT_664542 [Hyaloraphidium curvatum]|nr:hypothetical protein DFJ74DRAFT_664542 [Hyaloraphidium curvatum]